MEPQKRLSCSCHHHPADWSWDKYKGGTWGAILVVLERKTKMERGAETFFHRRMLRMGKIINLKKPPGDDHKKETGEQPCLGGGTEGGIGGDDGKGSLFYC